jgi:hypothetical protein
MWILNTLTVNGRTYSQKDIVKIDTRPVDDRLYGGRIKKIGFTDTDVLLLLDSNMKVFDTVVVDLSSLDVGMLKQMAVRKKMKHKSFISKEDLINLILGRPKEETPKAKKRPYKRKKSA